MNTTQLIVAILMTVANVVLLYVNAIACRNIGYYTAWREVWAAMRVHTENAPSKDLAVIREVSNALGDKFDKCKK